MTGSAPAPRAARRGAVLSAAVIVAAGAFLTSTRTWLTVHLDEAELTRTTITVTGQQAAPALTACALVALAAAAALAIARGAGRVVAAVLLGAAGCGVTASALVALRRPADAAEALLSERTGLVHAPASIETTIWPWCAVAAGVLLVAVAVWAAVVQRRWRVTARFEAARFEAARDAASPVAGATAAGEASHTTSGDTAATDPAEDPAGTWDALSAGQDPTRGTGPGPEMPE